MIDPQARIADKHIGPMTEAFVRDKLLPMIEGLRRQGPHTRDSASELGDTPRTNQTCNGAGLSG